MNPTSKSDTAAVRRTPKGKQPRYFQDPATDKLLAMVMTLAEELSVTRDRLDSLEQVLASRELLTADAVEDFEPSQQVEQEREQRRAQFVGRLLGPLQAELDQATAADHGRSVGKTAQPSD